MSVFIVIPTPCVLHISVLYICLPPNGMETLKSGTTTFPFYASYTLQYSALCILDFLKNVYF